MKSIFLVFWCWKYVWLTTVVVGHTHDPCNGGDYWNHLRYREIGITVSGSRVPICIQSFSNSVAGVFIRYSFVTILIIFYDLLIAMFFTFFYFLKSHGGWGLQSGREDAATLRHRTENGVGRAGQYFYRSCSSTSRVKIEEVKKVIIYWGLLPVCYCLERKTPF